MWTAVRTRLAVEWASRDVRALLLLGSSVAVFGAMGNVSGNETATPSGAATLAAVTLLTLWPLVVGGLAALIAARDEEVGAPALAFTSGIPRGDVVWVQAWAALALAAGLALATLVTTAAVTAALRGFGGGKLGVDILVAMTLSAPLWAVAGILIGSRAGSRAKALGVLTAVVLVLVLVLRLAVSIPVFRWVNVALPLGFGEALVDGFNRSDFPDNVHPVLLLGFAVVDLAIPLALALRHAQRRRRLGGDARRSRRALLAAFVLAPAFGYVAPSAFVSVIPWRLSPTWILDEASGATPDRSVRSFVDALAAGDKAEAATWTASGSTDETLGLLADAWSPMPEVEVVLHKKAPVAGTVRVTWRGANGVHTVWACSARFLDGWRVARFTSRTSCGAVRRG